MLKRKELIEADLDGVVFESGRDDRTVGGIAVNFGQQAVLRAMASVTGMHPTPAPARAKRSHVEISRFTSTRPLSARRAISQTEMAETPATSVPSIIDETMSGSGSAAVTQRNQMWVSRTIISKRPNPFLSSLEP